MTKASFHPGQEVFTARKRFKLGKVEAKVLRGVFCGITHPDWCNGSERYSVRLFQGDGKVGEVGYAFNPSRVHETEAEAKSEINTWIDIMIEQLLQAKL